MPDISDARLAELLRAEQVARVADSVWNDPKLGAALKRGVKDKYPDAPIPEFDLVEPAIAPISKRLDEVSQQLAALKSGIEAKDQDRDLRGKLTRAADEFGLTTAGRERLEKFMLETQTPDPAVAAAALVRSEPALVTSSASASDELIFDPKAQDEDDKRLWDDPMRWAVGELTRGLTPANRR